MKKVLSVMLTLLLCLSSSAAVAEAAPSITLNDLISVKDQVEGLELSIAENQTITIKQLMLLTQASSVAEYFGDESVEGFALDEFFAVTFDKIPAVSQTNGKEETSIPVLFQVIRSYESGEKVVVKLGIFKGAEIEWLSFDAAAKGNWVIIVTKPEKLAALLQNTALVAILSK